MPKAVHDLLDSWFLIWSHEHAAWWRADSMGYTDHLTAAGLYSAVDAAQIERRSGPSRHGHDKASVAVSLAMALDAGPPIGTGSPHSFTDPK